MPISSSPIGPNIWSVGVLVARHVDLDLALVELALVEHRAEALARALAEVVLVGRTPSVSSPAGGSRSRGR